MVFISQSFIIITPHYTKRDRNLTLQSDHSMNASRAHHTIQDSSPAAARIHGIGHEASSAAAVAAADEAEYDQIIKDSLQELEENQLEEQMFKDMLQDTIVQSKKEYDDIERNKIQTEITNVKNDPNKLHQKTKEIVTKTTNIITKDGVQKHGKLPPLISMTKQQSDLQPYEPQVCFLPLNV